MLKAVLFDLDNTLIFFDEVAFFRKYLDRISRVFDDIMDFKVFRDRIISSTQAILENDGEASNADYFMNVFSEGFEDRRDELWKRFLDFYATEFDQFKKLAKRVEGVTDIFRQLQNKNLKLVIASNPFWPESIQMKRLAWAGLEDVPFDLVTHIENMTSCKPRLEYYREICQKIDERPESCLMVGNDPVNDMIVSKIGMKTFLTIDCLKNLGSSLLMSNAIRNQSIEDFQEPDFRGSILEVVGVVEQLMAKPTN